MAQWSAKWISYAYDPRQDVGVFAFRRRLRLDSVPPKLDVRVSADQRYKLFVNGQLVEFGPQRGDALHWFYETIDLAPHLRAGDNWISALVWNFGWMAPMAQCTVRSGFLFEPLDADQKDLATPHGWEVGLLKNWGFDMMHAGKGGYYIDVGPGELIDFRGAPWGWRVGEEPPGSVQWREPHVVYQAEDRGS
ncbi:MAG TPA: hypothetical protein VM328_03835, partial [Fimbriimonadaceae bacterium]|nr:hypothetical protein [Fimbriimonadaceae bacterium]